MARGPDYLDIPTIVGLLSAERFDGYLADYRCGTIT
jgi:hypothetical protein